MLGSIITSTWFVDCYSSFKYCFIVQVTERTAYIGTSNWSGLFLFLCFDFSLLFLSGSLLGDLLTLYMTKLEELDKCLGDYFTTTGGAGLVITHNYNSTDELYNMTTATQLNDIFMRDWNSEYSRKLY